nr:RNA 2',3'-cyclic phosphodiesterase [Promineifilum sp.]
MNTIRAFIAVPLSDEVKHGLGDVVQALSGRIPRGAVRWVRPEHMHLTLWFLGDTPADQLAAIRRGMDAAARHNPPFTLLLGDLGCFPTCQRPRVIWVALAGEVNRLASLRTALDGPLLALGRPPEAKPFRAHLTPGRVKKERDVRG